MAALSITDAIRLIKTPKNAREILKARLKRQRHRLHTETEVLTDELLYFQPHHFRFLDWVKRILQSDANFARFQNLYRPPLATNQFVESIFSQFEKIFQSENKYEKFNFTDSDLEADAATYRKQMGDIVFWETQGFETMKDSIDNVLIIDLPTSDIKTDDQYPRPYYYILDIDNLIDIDNIRVKAVDYDGDEPEYFFKTEYVIFREDAKTVCVFDDKFFRTFNYEPGTNEPSLITEVAHDLQYCPARSFWTTPLNSKSNIQKRGPITNSISELDLLLFNIIAGTDLKTYAQYPIIAIYKSICKYKNDSQSTRCIDGWMWTSAAGGMQGQKTNERCPKCSKIKTGPGNILEVDAPQTKDDQDLMKNPIKLMPADQVSVDVVNKEIEDKKDCIFEDCVGGGIEVDQSQAKNQDQIAAAFESKTNKLLWIKKNFETIHMFAIDTIFRLRYGDKYISGTIDYGDVFFQKDESSAMAEYKIAKEEELPAFDLAIRRDKINESKYRNNPDMIERLRILSNLDPFPDDNQISMAVTFGQMPDIVDPIDLCLKTHFDRFVARFEREQSNILLFGSALSFDKKIKIISDILNGYAKEYLTARKKNAVTFPMTQGATPAPPIRVKDTTAPVT